MFVNHKGTTALEWIIVATVVTLVISSAVLTLAGTISTEFKQLNVSLSN
jgi:hypothetical protein